MKLDIKLNVVLLLLITLLCLSGQTATAEGLAVNRLVIFGDSLSDQGKLYEKFQHVVPASPPYWRGRFSNGPIWTDILAEKYTLVNKSEGGAAAVDYRRYSNALKYKVANYLGKEVDQFLKTSTFEPTDLVIIWIGGNDYMTYNWNSPADIERVVLEHIIQIRRMKRLGAQHILAINLPDMGQAPFHPNTASRQHASDVTEYHNLRMKTQFDQAFDSDAVQIFDASNTFADVMSSPQNYGLQNTTDACFHGSYWGGILWTAQDHASPLGPVEPIESLAARQDFLRSLMPTSNAPVQAAPFWLWWPSTPKCEGYVYMDSVHPSHDMHTIIAKTLDEYIQQHYRSVGQ